MCRTLNLEMPTSQLQSMSCAKCKCEYIISCEFQSTKVTKPVVVPAQ